MRNLEERQQADVNVTNIKGVLRSCFGINMDMVQVIDDATTVAVALMAMEGGLPPGRGGTSTSLQQQGRSMGGERGVEQPQSQQHGVGGASITIVAGNNSRGEPLLPTFPLAARDE